MPYKYSDADFPTDYYIRELHELYKYWCFTEKNAEVCYKLADFYESMPKDFNRSYPIYKMNCIEHDHSDSCFKFGNYIMRGLIGLRRDHFRAAAIFDKGCHLNHGMCCMHAALLRLSSRSKIPKNVTRARLLLEKSCNLKVGVACYYLSAMYMDGYGMAIKENLELAFKYGVRGCELGNIVCCYNVSTMYKKGDGVAHDGKMSQHYYHLFHWWIKAHERNKKAERDEINQKPY